MNNSVADECDRFVNKHNGAMICIEKFSVRNSRPDGWYVTTYFPDGEAVVFSTKKDAIKYAKSMVLDCWIISIGWVSVRGEVPLPLNRIIGNRKIIDKRK